MHTLPTWLVALLGVGSGCGGVEDLRWAGPCLIVGGHTDWVPHINTILEITEFDCILGRELQRPHTFLDLESPWAKLGPCYLCLCGEENLTKHPLLPPGSRVVL